MGTLGNPSGTFSIENSDQNVGSYLLKRDFQEIFGLSDIEISTLPFIRDELTGELVIDENVLYHMYKKLPMPPSIYKPFMSLDELILIAVIKRAKPDVVIERQVPFGGRPKIDILLTIRDMQLFIEYDGPSHFTHQYRAPENPLDRKKQIEDAFSIECVSWPYWIHKCELNVKALFDNSIEGYGALWSTNRLFGEFVFPNSADIIDIITKRFRAAENGYGYFYEENSRGSKKPKHPIIAKIKSGKVKVDRLKPSGALEINKWIPKELVNI